MESMKTIATASAKNIQFIQQLQQYGTIQSAEVADVLKTVDRGDFCPNNPYVDTPQQIGYNVTISAPHMHIHAMVALKLSHSLFRQHNFGRPAPSHISFRFRGRGLPLPRSLRGWMERRYCAGAERLLNWRGQSDTVRFPGRVSIAICFPLGCSGLRSSELHKLPSSNY